jgi:UDP-glucose 4-epimerase
MTDDSTAATNILLLGSKGFIGGSLVRSLSASGEFVVRGLDLPELDLTDERQVGSLLPRWVENAVVVVTAAITRDKDDSAAAMISNIKMVSNLAQVLKEHPARQLIYLSTVDVYGRRNLKLPLNESSAIQPSNYYGISKITREYVLRLACAQAAIPLAVLRLPGVYGPSDTHNSPIRVFITKALTRRAIAAKGNGSELRDFLYVDDVGEVIVQVVLKRICGTFNIVTGGSHSITDVLKMIERCCGHSIDVSFRGRQDDTDLVFEASAILAEIPAFTFTSIEEGLSQTVRDYQEELSGHCGTVA